ncbi:stage V sporulation protein AE [Scopulibacillus daqui]|uniref:Stage V sporulation protein AE n=1 Tax=Scopulibacillus daqui TaxID=1469162 RepID=A0ABS2Q1U2_9BACL|nr:stage V sporulation protein AE [Scopulibacillus daqui]MBM7646239.1 stage V sporulation protein AE [Scopulibacillus daqui]
MKRHVILITDGDKYAREAVEHTAKRLGCRCISQTEGNPTQLSGQEIVDLIQQTPYDPVLVMFDDCGFKGKGPGEAALEYVATHPSIEVLGAIAVASHSSYREWSKVDVSIDQFGELTEYGVDKEGLRDLEIGRISGDTVYVLDYLDIPVIVGIGDIGKMRGLDKVENGSPITTKAVEVILERSGYHRNSTERKETNL